VTVDYVTVQIPGVGVVLAAVLVDEIGDMGSLGRHVGLLGWG
jgi:hypothetical protein